MHWRDPTLSDCPSVDRLAGMTFLLRVTRSTDRSPLQALRSSLLGLACVAAFCLSVHGVVASQGFQATGRDLPAAPGRAETSPADWLIRPTTEKAGVYLGSSDSE